MNDAYDTQVRRGIPLPLILFALVLLSVVVYFILNMLTLLLLPEGELVNSVDSPDGKYTVNLYLCAGNATNADSVRGELVYRDRILFKRRNIYWQYRETSAVAMWESDEIVVINGVKLDVNGEAYDYRKEID